MTGENKVSRIMHDCIVGVDDPGEKDEGKAADGGERRKSLSFA